MRNTHVLPTGGREAQCPSAHFQIIQEVPLIQQKPADNRFGKHLPRRIITLAVTICMVFSLAAPALADNSCSMDRRDRESELSCTLGDLAAARLAVYGILDRRYRTPHRETAEPLSRLDAVRLLWYAFADDTVLGAASEKNDPAKGKDSAGRYSVIRMAESDDTVESSVMFSFADVPLEYAAVVDWSCRNGITEGISDTEFGLWPVSEPAFVTMLLNAVGYAGEFDPALSVQYAESIGITPVGLSRHFTLGDAALYLQSAMEARTKDGTPVRETMNIRREKEQTTFPASVILTPLFPEDAERQIREATRYLASAIEVRGDYLSKEDLYSVYEGYFRASRESGEMWYLSRVHYGYRMDAAMDVLEYTQLPEDTYKTYTAVAKTLWEQYSMGKLSSQDYFDTCLLEEAKYLSSGKAVTLTTRYSEAWELVCDLDDAFTLYVDDTITTLADEFYQRNVAGARNDLEAVYRAKNAIITRADYAAAEEYDAQGNAVYPVQSHSILGFFRNGQIVCDGYASVFQYLMLRAGVDCVMVLGSTVSRQDAENGGRNHAWNKVRVDGTWYNMDVCWADTGYLTLYDLKSSQFYADHQHWAVVNADL